MSSAGLLKMWPIHLHHFPLEVLTCPHILLIGVTPGAKYLDDLSKASGMESGELAG